MNTDTDPNDGVCWTCGSTVRIVCVEADGTTQCITCYLWRDRFFDLGAVEFGSLIDALVDRETDA